MDVSWNEAWPLFVILVGVATLVTSLIDRRPGRWTFWALTWPIVWIGVGIVLLLSTTGRLAMGPGELITEYWPWLPRRVGRLVPDRSVHPTWQAAG
jgi:hypothetical protein